MERIHCIENMNLVDTIVLNGIVGYCETHDNGDTPIDIDHIDETNIVSMMGKVESQYYRRYSDLTGYLWTDRRRRGIRVWCP